MILPTRNDGSITRPRTWERGLGVALTATPGLRYRESLNIERTSESRAVDFATQDEPHAIETLLECASYAREIGDYEGMRHWYGLLADMQVWLDTPAPDPFSRPEPAANAEPDYISIDEAATILNLNRASVSRYCKRGDLPAIRPGYEWILRREDVEAFTPRPRGNPAWVK